MDLGNSPLNSAIAKYLQHYAEPETELARSLCRSLNKRWVLVIPAYDEQPDFITRLSQHPDAAELLLIAVLNAPQGFEERRCHDFVATLDALSEPVSQAEHLSVKQLGALTVLLVERRGDLGLPAKQGVGLARKIGADIAAALISIKVVSCPWIYSSDADAHLPENYFFDSNPDDAEGLTRCSAQIFDFDHSIGEGIVLSATRLYERCLRYYTAQLAAAGSAYAYHSLGSCIAISMPHYCSVRGFPRRAAGEDFYLLNKLSKVAPLRHNAGICVRLEARISNRVPFGTGPSVERFVSLLTSGEPPRYYNPAIFNILGQTLSEISRAWTSPNWAEGISDRHAQETLRRLGFTEFHASRRQQDKSEAQFLRHFHQWFDALKTLQFIHILQAEAYPSVGVDTLFGEDWLEPA